MLGKFTLKLRDVRAVVDSRVSERLLSESSIFSSCSTPENLLIQKDEALFRRSIKPFRAFPSPEVFLLVAYLKFYEN